MCAGELKLPCALHNKKKKKKMDKKMYFEPEMEVVELKLQGMLCVSGGEEGGETPTGGGEGEDTPGGW